MSVYVSVCIVCFCFWKELSKPSYFNPFLFLERAFKAQLFQSIALESRRVLYCQFHTPSFSIFTASGNELCDRVAALLSVKIQP